MNATNRKLPRVPQIVVPKPSDEQPRFGRVGAIAAIGFLIGVAWPALARMKLAPQPSDGFAAAVPSASSAPGGDGLASALPADSAAPAAPLPPKAVGPKVRLADIVNCVDADGRKHVRYDAPALDSVLSEPLKSLLACDGAEGQSGTLSLGFDLDFGSGSLSRFTVGRSTTLDTALARAIADCAKQRLSQVDVQSIEHNFASYRVFYLVEFSRAQSTPSPAPASASDAQATVAAASDAAAGPAGEGEIQGQSGRATVTWDVAIVRKAPKEGAIVARVLGGTRVVVTGRQGDWYRIKYNAKGDEGFVFKSAIGL